MILNILLIVAAGVMASLLVEMSKKKYRMSPQQVPLHKYTDEVSPFGPVVRMHIHGKISWEQIIGNMKVGEVATVEVDEFLLKTLRKIVAKYRKEEMKQFTTIRSKLSDTLVLYREK